MNGTYKNWLKVKIGFALACCALALALSPAKGQSIDFGIDGIPHINGDGQCDDSRFSGPSRYVYYNGTDWFDFKDASDCRRLHGRGLIRMKEAARSIVRDEEDLRRNLRNIENSRRLSSEYEEARSQLDSSSMLERGRIYCFPTGTPVMALHPDSVNAENMIDSIQNSIQISENVAVRILAIDRNVSSSANTWYNVESVRGTTVVGWVNNSALLRGQVHLCE